MRLQKPSLITAIILPLTLVFIGAGSLSAYLWIKAEISYFESELNQTRQKLTDSSEQSIKSRVLYAEDRIISEREKFKERIEVEVVNALNDAYNLLDLYSTFNSRVVGEEKTLTLYSNPLDTYKSIVDRIYYYEHKKPLDVAYFDGEDFLNLTNASVFSDSIKESFYQLIMDNKKEGHFYSDDGYSSFYYRYHDDLNLLIYGNINYDEVEQDLKKSVLIEFSKEKHDATTEGYLFATDYKGDVYLTEWRYFGGSKNIWDLQDSDGLYFVREGAKVAKEKKEGGFLYYGFRRDGEEIRKVAFVKAVDEWGLYIGSGVSLNDVDEIIKKNIETLREKTYQKSIKVGSLLLFAILTAALVIFAFGKRLNKSIEEFKDSIKNAAVKEIEVDNNSFKFKEFDEIANFSNLIIKRLHDQNQRLEFKSRHDDLTSLPNRVNFETFIDGLITRSKNTDVQFAVFYLDLDNFKEINDTIGHHVGDLLLTIIAERLKNHLGSEDMVARIGGDEFLIASPGINCTEDAELIAARILNQFEAPFDLDGALKQISASVGVSLFPLDASTCSELLANADMAMYEAKRMGKNSFRLFNPDLLKAIELRIEYSNSISDAINNNEFSLHYQPQFNVKTGEICGAEALIRWNHPVKGNIPPGDFIPLLEELGRMDDLGAWIINQACEFLAELHRLEGYEETLAINISNSQMEHHSVAVIIKEAIERFGCNPKQLEIEITESALMFNTDFTRQELNDLREIGVSVAIDDFGTGYSSLAVLKTLPLDKLKIDRTFIRDLCTHGDDRDIIKAIISLSQTLRLKVVAEGVEDKLQLDVLLSEGCDIAQGFYLGKPMPKDQFVDLIKELKS